MLHKSDRSYLRTRGLDLQHMPHAETVDGPEQEQHAYPHRRPRQSVWTGRWGTDPNRRVGFTART